MMLWNWRTFPTASLSPTMHPAKTSLCPPKYFEALWITRSAPKSSARLLMGVANVPSMHTRHPFGLHSFAMRSTSTHRRYGLVGDSEKYSEQSCSSSAFSRPS